MGYYDDETKPTFKQGSESEMKISEIFEGLHVYPSRRKVHDVIVDDYDRDEDMQKVAEVLRRFGKNIVDVKVAGTSLIVKVVEDGKRIQSEGEAADLVKYLLKDHEYNVN